MVCNGGRHTPCITKHSNRLDEPGRATTVTRQMVRRKESISMQPIAEPDTTGPRDPGGIILRNLLWIVCFLIGPAVLFTTPDLLAEDRVLAQSGIHYPEGYDLNTVGEVRGTAQNVVKPEKGPVHFTVVSRSDRYTVFASPLWYWNDYEISVRNGDEVVVTGSKSLGKDGNLYIIAREVRFPSANRSVVFRAKDGLPLWRPFGNSTGRGGFGLPAGSKGGVGPGGGAGRGKR